MQLRGFDEHGRASWPACSDAIFARARELAAGGASQEEIREALAAEFPGLPGEAYYQNPAAIVVMERLKGRQREAEREQAHAEWRRRRGIPAEAASSPGIAPMPISNKMRAFAAAHGHRCDACGRQGTGDGDPDGEAWHEARRAGGHGYALVCSACLKRPKGASDHAEV